MNPSASFSGRLLPGLFGVSLAVVAFEILLTRVFSVTMWYHFAFMAVSLAMLGLTAGAIAVFRSPSKYDEEGTYLQLRGNCLAFSWSMVLCFLAQLSVPFRLEASLVSGLGMLLIFTLLTIPFYFAGIVICLCLTRFPERIGALYAADLIGAGCGCGAFLLLIEFLDAPTAIVALASGVAFCSFIFGTRRYRKLGAITILSGLLFLALVATQLSLQAQNRNLWRLIWVRGAEEQTPLAERWNAYSRVAVFGDPEQVRMPLGWGLSPLTPQQPVSQLLLTIDAGASTFMTAYAGQINQIEHLRYDITNMAHSLLQDADVAILGAGGGRDILSAILFDQKRILALEMNADIVDLVYGNFAEFTGDLRSHPKVQLEVSEARSYLTRNKENFDLIQISLIDTWAATAAGAYALSENGLYTQEAWTLLWERLNPGGILSTTRWYFKQLPGEIYRSISLATTVLRNRGIQRPREHLAIVRYLHPELPTGVGTLLVKKTPFKKTEIQELTRAAHDLKFEVALSPWESLDPNLAALTEVADLTDLRSGFPIDVTAPTDNRPFFFNMLKPEDIAKPSHWQQGNMSSNLQAVSLLALLFLVTSILSAVFIFVPLWTTRSRRPQEFNRTHLCFFSCLGFGFMLFEVAALQRFSIYLGHPTLGFSVVLVVLLIGSGVGSLYSSRSDDAAVYASGLRRLLLLPPLLSMTAFAIPWLSIHTQALPLPLRICVAGLLLLPSSFLMGMAFPFGLRLVEDRHSSWKPWYWAANGAASVCGSVLAVFLALAFGIQAVVLLAAAVYAVAALGFWIAGRSPQAASVE